MPTLSGIREIAANQLIAQANNDARTVNAIQKALANINSGVQVEVMSGGFKVQSARQPFAFHRIKNGLCTCEAANYGKPCWHVKAIEIAAGAQAVALAQMNELF
jgi:hypothetical protein